MKGHYYLIISLNKDQNHQSWSTNLKIFSLYTFFTLHSPALEYKGEDYFLDYIPPLEITCIETLG